MKYESNITISKFNFNNYVNMTRFSRTAKDNKSELFTLSSTFHCETQILYLSPLYVGIHFRFCHTARDSPPFLPCLRLIPPIYILPSTSSSQNAILQEWKGTKKFCLKSCQTSAIKQAYPVP